MSETNAVLSIGGFLGMGTLAPHDSQSPKSEQASG